MDYQEKKKRQHKVCVLSEHHKVNSVYGRIDRHLVGFQQSVSLTALAS